MIPKNVTIDLPQDMLKTSTFVHLTIGPDCIALNTNALYSLHFGNLVLFYCSIYLESIKVNEKVQ